MLLNVLILFIFILCFKFWRMRPWRFPPGPFSWPIFGNISQVGMEPYKSVMKLKRKYGNIIGIDLGIKRSFFINDYHLVKEAFNIFDFCGRPPVPHFINPFNGKEGGIISTNGKIWTEQRGFAFKYIQSSFRNGIPFETLVQYEAKELVTSLKDYGETPISTESTFIISAINSLWSIIAGERYCCTDEKYLQLAQHAGKSMSDAATQGVLLFFPFLGKLMPRLSGYERLLTHLKPLFIFCQDIIDAHRQSFQEDVERDFVDCYLRKIKSTTDPESSFFKEKGYENLLQSLFHLFLAGSETVSTTLRWVVFLLAHHQNVQRKLIYSIEQFHKSGRDKISLKDRPLEHRYKVSMGLPLYKEVHVYFKLPAFGLTEEIKTNKLPYVEAVIWETLRFSSIAPLGAVHKASIDLEFHGYLIPKETMVFANLYGIHHDSNVWGDPENFRPERFLSENETELIKHPALNPFSTGKRVCPGESLARDELFIFTVHLAESFKVQFDPRSPVPPLDYIVGTTLLPVEHKIIFHRRNN